MDHKKKVTADVKKLLRSVNYANITIDRINRLIEITRSRAEKVTTSYSDAPGGGHNPDSRADVYAKLIDLERQQTAAVGRWCQAIKDVQVVISWLDDFNERAVLEARYINCEDWLTISLRLNYSVQHLYYMHGKALFNLAQLLNEYKRKSELNM